MPHGPGYCRSSDIANYVDYFINNVLASYCKLQENKMCQLVSRALKAVQPASIETLVHN